MDSAIHQGPVARSLVSANRWLRGIKMYRFPWYLTLVSTNHASSNPGQINLYPVDKYMIRETNCAIHWIVFYPLDSAIQPLNNGPRCIKLWYSELDDAIWQTKSTRPAQAWNILLMSSATAPSVVFITFLFFVSLVLIDLYMSIQFCAIDCVLYFFPCNVAHNWNPVPYIFWHWRPPDRCHLLA